MRPAVTTYNLLVLIVICCYLVSIVLAKPGSGYGRAVRGNEWVPHVNFTTGKMCHSRLKLPPGYDRLRLPTKPMEVQVEFEIRQVRRVQEEKMSYRVALLVGLLGLLGD